LGSDTRPIPGRAGNGILESMINPSADRRSADAMDPVCQPRPWPNEFSFLPEDVAALKSPEPPPKQLRWRIPLWKRALDLALIALTVPIWLPLMLLLMAAIKISSSGPIFYRQERVGLGGQLFMIFKFRSMKVDAQTSGHELHVEQLMRGGEPMTKLDASDSRIIPWGRFLRASGLDELPQISNVLRGEMSLAGPRPCTRIEFEKYEEWQTERVSVPPGITGYWQVNGKNRTTFQQMIEMDLFYARNVSLRLDLRIMLMTPATLATQVLELAQRPARKLTSQDAVPKRRTLMRQPIGERIV
jgi:exopolysaccharide production protein ExoY